MSYISPSYWLISKPTLSTQHYLLPLRKSSSPFQQSLTILLSPFITPYLFLPHYLALCLSLFVSLSLYLCLFVWRFLSISLSTYLSLSLSLSFYIHTSQFLSPSFSLSLSPSALERAALAKAKTCCCPAERFVPPVVLYVRVEKII